MRKQVKNPSFEFLGTSQKFLGIIDRNSDTEHLFLNCSYRYEFYEKNEWFIREYSRNESNEWIRQWEQ